MSDRHGEEARMLIAPVTTPEAVARVASTLRRLAAEERKRTIEECVAVAEAERARSAIDVGAGHASGRIITALRALSPTDDEAGT